MFSEWSLGKVISLSIACGRYLKNVFMCYRDVKKKCEEESVFSHISAVCFSLQGSHVYARLCQQCNTSQNGKQGEGLEPSACILKLMSQNPAAHLKFRQVIEGVIRS